MSLSAHDILVDAGATGNPINGRTINIKDGGAGHNGVGVYYPKLDTGSPLVLPAVRPMVIHTPSMYDDEFTEMSVFIKTFFETMVRRLDGFDFQYDTRTEGGSIGFDSQNLVAPTGVKRSAITPTANVQERFGNICWKGINRWQRDMFDPDTQISQTRFSNPKDWVISTWSAAILFIVYEPTHRSDQVLDGIFVTNIFPNNSTMYNLNFNTQEATTPDRNFEFSAYYQHNDYTKLLAQAGAELLNIRSARWDYATSQFDEIIGSIKGTGSQADVTLANDTFTMNAPSL